jgi:hypothetical protein
MKLSRKKGRIREGKSRLINALSFNWSRVTRTFALHLASSVIGRQNIYFTVHTAVNLNLEHPNYSA